MVQRIKATPGRPRRGEATTKENIRLYLIHQSPSYVRRLEDIAAKLYNAAKKNPLDNAKELKSAGEIYTTLALLAIGRPDKAQVTQFIKGNQNVALGSADWFAQVAAQVQAARTGQPALPSPAASTIEDAG